MKKGRKMRGSRTHGHGRGRSHNRGSGNRGGKGNAGTGKKADTKKPTHWNNPKYFGKYGFQGSQALTVINVADIDARIESLMLSGKVKEGSTVALNLTDLGYEKLLGTGSLRYPVTVTVAAASKAAIEKVQKAGGTVSCA